MSEEESQENKEPSIDIDIVEEEEEEEQEAVETDQPAGPAKKKGAEMVNCIEFLPLN